VLNFYQINKDSEIQIRNRLIIKTLISYQRTNLTQKLKLLGEVSRNDLYYSLINNINKNKILINLQIITLLQYSFDCSEDIDLQNLIQLRLRLFCTCFCVYGAKTVVRCLVTVKLCFVLRDPLKN